MEGSPIRNFMVCLTDQEKKLIEQHLDEVQKKIEKNIDRIIRISGIDISSYSSKEDFVHQALSYVCEAYREYKPDVLKSSLPSFLAQRCLYRLLDEHRRMIDVTRLAHQRQRFVRRMKDEVVKLKGYCEQVDLYKQISKYNAKRVDKIMESVSLGCTKIPRYSDLFCIEDTRLELNLMEWSIFAEEMSKKADMVFAEDSESSVVNRFNKIAKKIIKEFLLPYSNSVDKKTMTDIANDVGMSKSALTLILKSNKMKKFFENSGVKNVR